ncbi:MAG: hypothetical protein GXX93_08515, partial [Anaerolineae bacterium]|nr:hypothetical protein [Anaerolineae bacterium]
MSTLLAGTATTDITPPLGAYLAGYYRPRQAEEVHDPLLARALCLSDSRREIAFVSCDLVGLSAGQVAQAKERITELCGLTPAQVLVGCTHTHTGPETRATGMFPVDPVYAEILTQRIADAAV